jgi:hypothetical protein
MLRTSMGFARATSSLIGSLMSACSTVGVCRRLIVESLITLGQDQAVNPSTGPVL